MTLRTSEHLQNVAQYNLWFDRKPIPVAFDVEIYWVILDVLKGSTMGIKGAEECISL